MKAMRLEAYKHFAMQKVLSDSWIAFMF